MEIYDRQNKGYIEVWLTSEEQQFYDRTELTRLILSKAKNQKCRVVFFLSGKGDLFKNTENLLRKNVECV